MFARYVALMLVVELIGGVSAPAQEHLEPEQNILHAQTWQWDYARTIREVLLKDAAEFHVARMVCLSSFEPEWVVTVVRDDPEDYDTPHSYFVEYAGAGRRLFNSREPQKIKVTKSRAPIDRTTAELLNKTWRRMLRRTRYPDEPRLGADGVSYHFSRRVALTVRGGNDPDWGWEQGQIWSPDDDSPCGELVAIGEGLKAYALARPPDRDKLCAGIRERVKRLSRTLDRLERKK